MEFYMKKQFLGLLVYFIIAFSLFGQSIDKAKYKAIDPFDYKLEEDQAPKGAVRMYKSVVQFASENGTVLSFYSLDKNTLLALKVNKHFEPMTANLKVAIYYTATKGIIDTLVLDDIDYTATSEEAIGLKKSPVAPSNINRSSYREIDPFDYKMEAENAERGSVRKYKATVLFSAQSGITHSFTSLDSATLLSLKVNRRLNPMKENQKITIYYTATKGIIDALILDDAEF
jgi:hypothetical protein